MKLLCNKSDANTKNMTLIITIIHLPMDRKFYYKNIFGKKWLLLRLNINLADLDSGTVTFELEAKFNPN